MKNTKQVISTAVKSKVRAPTLDGFIIIMCFFVFVFILAFGMATYSVRMENQRLNIELTRFQSETVDNFVDVAIEYDRHDENLKNLNEDSRLKTNKISVIEESIDPENSRWAKIKLVREAVKDIIEQFGYSKVPNIQGLTAFAGAVVEYSEQYDVPVTLILGITTQESAFNVQAVSHAGAQGLMQVMPGTAREISQDIGQRHYSMFKIRDSVHFGTWYLWKMMDRFEGQVDFAIRAYNCGPICVEKVRAGSWPDYPKETQNYVEMVKFWMARYENMGL